MVEDSLKGVIRAAGWLQLDLILYGPRTVLNSFGFTNLFGRSSESTSRQFPDERAYESTNNLFVTSKNEFSNSQI